MKLYDEMINTICMQLKNYPVKSLTVRETDWPDDGNNGIILKRDMAYELGGGNLAATSCQMLTNNSELIKEDQILLYGPELSKIKADAPYARILFLRVKEREKEEGSEIYSIVRRLEYQKYQVHPHGYMSRISSTNHREPVRISKKALKEGLSFEEVGNQYLKQYHKDPDVEAAVVLFITDPKFPFEIVKKQAEKAEQITEALDHMLKDFSMDCKTCKLKDVCDEVEEIRELHFQKK